MDGQPAYAPRGEYDYAPVAVYYEDADSLEYVRRDEPAVYRRIDDLLTLILSMQGRELLGFQLKGFRHFYLEITRETARQDDGRFPRLVAILEEAVKRLGNEVFSEKDRLDAYVRAQDLAKEDEVQLHEIPSVA